MLKENFTKYCAHLISEFRTCFKSVSESQRKEDIHRLRVSLKKLRTIWKVIELASNSEWKKKEHSEMTKQLFKLAGRVREAQVNKEMIGMHALDISDHYIKILSHSENSHSKRLKEYTGEFDLKQFDQLNEKMMLVLDTLPVENLNDAISELLKSKTRAVFNRLNKTSEKIKLHKIRIHLKGIQQLILLRDKLNLVAVKGNLEKKIKKTSNALGEWHDYQILLQSISEQSKHYRKSSQIELIGTQLNNEQENRKHQIYKLLNSCKELFENTLAQD